MGAARFPGGNLRPGAEFRVFPARGPRPRRKAWLGAGRTRNSHAPGRSARLAGDRSEAQGTLSASPASRDFPAPAGPEKSSRTARSVGRGDRDGNPDEVALGGPQVRRMPNLGARLRGATRERQRAGRRRSPGEAGLAERRGARQARQGAQPTGRRQTGGPGSREAGWTTERSGALLRAGLCLCLVFLNSSGLSPASHCARASQKAYARTHLERG